MWMNDLFSDFFKEVWTGISKGCSRLFRGGFGRFLVETTREIRGKQQENYIGKKTAKL